MVRTVFRVAWYRFRATFRRRWGGYLAIVLLIGLVGGLAMGSIAGARRTQSSFPVYLASTNPSDLQGVTSFVNPTSGAAGLGYNPSLPKAIAHLPHVKDVSTEAGLNLIPLTSHGVPESPAAYPASAGEVIGLASSTGRSLDSPTVIQGRTLDFRRADEFVVTATTAQVFRLHLGEVVRFGIYTNAQTVLPTFGTAGVAPYRTAKAKLVGIVVGSTSVVEDDTDAQINAFLFAFTPALTKPLLTCCTYYSATAVKASGGSRNVTVLQ